MRLGVFIVLGSVTTSALASVKAISPNLLRSRDVGTICASVGGSCEGHEPDICCKEMCGYAYCSKGKIKFTPCDDDQDCIVTGKKGQCR